MDSEMKIEAFLVAWNESETIHLTIKHYQQFCSRITVFDNYSDDGTPDICHSIGCEVRAFGIRGVLDDREYTNLKNNCWKGSKADWVIVVDADEILQVDFGKITGTIIRPYGWNVFDHTMPKENWFELTDGFHDSNYSKLCCFNPREVTEIKYIHGCHVAKPEGNISIQDIGTLFHYRNVGGPQRLIERHRLYRPRMSGWNLKWNAGKHYLDEDEKRINDWKEQYQKRSPFVSTM